MKKIIILFTVIICMALVNPNCLKAQSVAINTDGSAPNTSAILDVKSNTKGMLVPRTSTIGRDAILNPAKGLLVYDTTSSSFWFYNASSWVQITGNNGWNLTGNAAINPISNFIGTTDAQPLRFRLNNLWAGALHPTSGNIFFGMRSGEVNTTGQANTSTGDHALFGNTTGNNNTVSGYQSLYSNINGFNNTASGYNAMYSNLAGSGATAIGTSAMLYSNNAASPFTNFNVAVGFEALRGSPNAANNTGVSNTAVGYQALLSNTSGYQNTAIGLQSLFYNTTGSSNTATGQGAMYSNDFGTFNTANGYGALAFNIKGNFNTAIGYQSLYSNDANYNTANGAYALYFNTTGKENTANGFSALYANTIGNQNTAGGNESLNYNISGSNNTAYGTNSLFLNQYGYGNTAIGHSALRSNLTGKSNTAIGDSALFNNIDGGGNTAAGYTALFSNTTGGNNIASGYRALFSNTIGHGNVASGGYALNSNTTSSLNTAIGFQALQEQSYNNGGINYTGGNVAVGQAALFNNNPISTVTGVYNTAIGHQALYTNQTGSGNSALGYNSGPNFNNLSNTTCIGNGATATANNQMVLGNANITQFYSYGAYAGTTANAANLTVLNTGQIVRSTSSRRYKKDIVPLEIDTKNIYKLRPVSYNAITDSSRHFGLIAEEVAEVIPELAEFAREKDVVKGSMSNKMIPDAVQYPLLSVLLLKEVQKHEVTINELKATIIEMKQVLKTQQEQLDTLKNNKQ